MAFAASRRASTDPWPRRWAVMRKGLLCRLSCLIQTSSKIARLKTRQNALPSRLKLNREILLLIKARQNPFRAIKALFVAIAQAVYEPLDAAILRLHNVRYTALVDLPSVASKDSSAKKRAARTAAAHLREMEVASVRKVKLSRQGMRHCWRRCRGVRLW